MNIASFIARRIQHTRGKSFSATVAYIGIASIAIGLAVMIISFAILGGFKQTIQTKIFSFGAHLQVSQFNLNNSLEETPVSTNTALYKNYQEIPEISHIQVFSYKAGLLKTDEDVLGVMLKGVGRDFNLNAFRQNMVEGRFVQFPDSVPKQSATSANPEPGNSEGEAPPFAAYSQDVVLSRKIAGQLRLKVNDSVLLYFVQGTGNRPRVRKLTVSGIYETGMEEFDEGIIMGDIRLIQRLNDWADTLVGGYEIYLRDFTQLDVAAEKVYDAMEYNMRVDKITDKYVQIFEWLTLLNKNVAIFLSLILFIACFNMVAILLILIMERTPMIGLLKSVGASDRQVQRVFMLGGIRLIANGLIWGNLIGIGFCAIQDRFKLIPLDPEAYYMDTVPIEWNFPLILLLNGAIVALVTLVLFIPTVIISRIRPVQALQFD